MSVLAEGVESEPSSISPSWAGRDLSSPLPLPASDGSLARHWPTLSSPSPLAEGVDAAARATLLASSLFISAHFELADLPPRVLVSKHPCAAISCLHCSSANHACLARGSRNVPLPRGKSPDFHRAIARTGSAAAHPDAEGSITLAAVPFAERQATASLLRLAPLVPLVHSFTATSRSSPCIFWSDPYTLFTVTPSTVLASCEPPPLRSFSPSSPSSPSSLAETRSALVDANARSRWLSSGMSSSSLTGCFGRLTLACDAGETTVCNPPTAPLRSTFSRATGKAR